jgi:hypothetical protein
VVYLGPKWVSANRPRLHDAPPGYRPPGSRIPLKERRREARQYRILIRIATVVLMVTAVVFLVLILVIIATHS